MPVPISLTEHLATIDSTTSLLSVDSDRKVQNVVCNSTAICSEPAGCLASRAVQFSPSDSTRSASRGAKILGRTENAGDFATCVLERRRSYILHRHSRLATRIQDNCGTLRQSGSCILYPRHRLDLARVARLQHQIVKELERRLTILTPRPTGF